MFLGILSITLSVIGLSLIFYEVKKNIEEQKELENRVLELEDLFAYPYGKLEGTRFEEYLNFLIRCETPASTKLRNWITSQSKKTTKKIKNKKK